MTKNKLREGLLDTALKGVVGVFFGKKLISKAAKSAAMRDPKVKQHVKKIKQAIADFDQIMADYE